MNRYEKHLQILQGLPVQRIGRAAELVWVMFGALRPRRVPRHADDVIGEWAVHIQCAWRFSHGDGIDSESARRGKRSKLKGRSPRQPRCLRDRVGRGSRRPAEIRLSRVSLWWQAGRGQPRIQLAARRKITFQPLASLPSTPPPIFRREQRL